jgi:hypothetical protein
VFPHQIDQVRNIKRSIHILQRIQIEHEGALWKKFFALPIFSANCCSMRSLSLS